MEYDVQKNIYFRNGGQIGNILAWLDEEINNLSNNFFTNTILTVQNSYIRPREPIYPSFQLEAGKILHEFFEGKIKENETIKSLENLFTYYNNITSSTK